MKTIIPILLIFISFIFFGCTSKHDANSPSPSEKDTVSIRNDSASDQTSLDDSITEIKLTPEQRKSYYACYKDPFIIHIRKALNAYLKGSNEGIDPAFAIEKRVDGDEVHGLDSFDKSYYMSKFLVHSVNDAEAGGEFISLVFLDKPDRIFHAWVYLLSSGKYELRGFWENTEYSKMSGYYKKAYREVYEDRKHSL